ncbi:MAG: choice-of-anchor J domain-containing protein [bacterium]
MTLTAPDDAAGFRFEVRVYHQDNNVDGFVYYDDFSVEAVNTNFPEPTHYPENFEATTTGLTITLNWADATGEQIPGAYLIYGQQGDMGDFPVPEDGTPVANDLDWSDDIVSVNVAYGLETYAFEGLTGGQSYEFVIYPYTNVGENINYKTDGDPPLASASVSNLVIINAEDFEDGTLGTWMQYSVEGPQVWEPYEFQGDIFARISGYDNGAVENEDWLISPELDLSSLQQASFEFISARNYAGEALQLYISQDYDGSGDPNLFDWTEMTDQANWSEGSWEWTASGDIDLSEFLAAPCHLAFKYISNTSEASAWEIDNILVFGESGVGIAESEVKQLIVFPNPSSGMFTVSAESAGHLELFNLSGQLVMELEIQAGLNRISTGSLKNGLYFLVLRSKSGQINRGKVLIN